MTRSSLRASAERSLRERRAKRATRSSQAHIWTSTAPRRSASDLELGVRHSYLKDFVYGAIDGAVTTFAVVSGVAGAGLSAGVIIVLGLANLVGDGFSMAASNFLGHPGRAAAP